MGVIDRKHYARENLGDVIVYDNIKKLHDWVPKEFVRENYCLDASVSTLTTQTCSFYCQISRRKRIFFNPRTKLSLICICDLFSISLDIKIVKFHISWRILVILKIRSIGSQVTMELMWVHSTLELSLRCICDLFSISLDDEICSYLYLVENINHNKVPSC